MTQYKTTAAETTSTVTTMPTATCAPWLKPPLSVISTLCVDAPAGVCVHVVSDVGLIVFVVSPAVCILLVLVLVSLPVGLIATVAGLVVAVAAALLLELIVVTSLAVVLMILVLVMLVLLVLADGNSVVDVSLAADVTSNVKFASVVDKFADNSDDCTELYN